MEVQQKRSCLTQRPKVLGCQKWMEINSADNAGPYLGAAGAGPGPGVPAGSDRARGRRDGRSGHCSVLWLHSWPRIHMQRIAGNQSSSYKAFNCTTAAQLRAVLFSPLSLVALFGHSFLPK